MSPRTTVRSSLLLAGTIMSLAAWPAVAQQPPAEQPAAPAAAAPAPAPAMAPVAAAPAAAPVPKPGQPGAPNQPLYGRPDNEAAMKLAPVPAPPIAAAPDKLPVGRLTLPKGFKIEVYASGIPDARSLRLGDKGTVFVGNRLQDKVYAIVDKGDKREVKVIASGLYRPNGLAFHNGTLYIAELSKVSKIDNIEDHLDNPPKPTLVYDDLPKEEAHGWKFIAVGPDNKLYIPVGQPGNNVLHDAAHGQIRRINLDGTGAEVVAFGVRNSVGFDWHPVTKELYFTDNGRDWLSEDVPNDELNRVTKVGQDFGAPYCYQGNIPDPEFGWGHSCSEFVAPVALMGPHAAALGMRFYTGKMFPADYHGAILIVDNKYIGRPVDVLVMKDGSLLISDDYDGAVYRVSYDGRTASR